MFTQKNVQDQKDQQPSIDPSLDQDIISLKYQLGTNNNKDNRHLNYPLGLIPFNYIKRKGCRFLFFAFAFYLLCSGYNNWSSPAEESKHSVNCIAIPSISWTPAEHIILQNRYRGLHIAHDMTDRLHVMGGLVHVRRNDQIENITMQFSLRLTDMEHVELFYFRQYIENDVATIIMHVKEEEGGEIYCILLDIDIELPSALGLDNVIITTSNSSIQVDDGMYFSKGIKLDTIDGNITITNSGAGIMELNTQYGFINCTSVQKTLGEQIIAHSIHGDINYKYADKSSLSPSSTSEISVRQPEKTWVSLTSASGSIRSTMCTDKNVLFDSLRQRSTSFFHRDFGGFGYGSTDVDKMLAINIKYIKSSLGSHHRGVWGSEDNINIHIITKTGKGCVTWIQFCCCDELNKKTC